MTAQLEHSQCPLVQIDSITVLFIVHRYDSSTGTFTVPPGGYGFYYFSVFLLVHPDKSAFFDIELNGQLICTATAGVTDYELTSCSAAVYAVAGRCLICI